MSNKPQNVAFTDFFVNLKPKYQSTSILMDLYTSEEIWNILTLDRRRCWRRELCSILHQPPFEMIIIRLDYHHYMKGSSPQARIIITIITASVTTITIIIQKIWCYFCSWHLNRYLWVLPSHWVCVSFRVGGVLYGRSGMVGFDSSLCGVGFSFLGAVLVIALWRPLPATSAHQPQARASARQAVL